MRYRFDRPVEPDSTEAHQIEIQQCTFGRILLLKTNTASYRRRIELIGGRRVLDPQTLCVRIPEHQLEPILLTWNDEVNRWEPKDVDDLEPFEWFEINRSLLKAANEEYNISEFVTAIETAMQMTEVPNAGSSKSKYTQRVGAIVEDDKTILDLLKEGRYFDAAALVRVNETSTWDETAKRYRYDKTGLKQADIKKIRHLAYGQMGVLYLEQQPVITLPQLVNAEQKIADFGKPVTDRVL